MVLDFRKKGEAMRRSDMRLLSHSQIRRNIKIDNLKPNTSVTVEKSKCSCCGTVLQFPSGLVKLKCAICQVTLTLSARESNKAINILTSSSRLSLSELKMIIEKCMGNNTDWKFMNKDQKCRMLEPVTLYLAHGFRDKQLLENSFVSTIKHEAIAYEELDEFYNVVMTLPSRRPFYQMICSCNDLLKKPGEVIKEYHWILVIFCNPMVRRCLVFKRFEGLDTPQIRAVSYELTKRCIGYLSNIPAGTLDKVIHYFKYLKMDIFRGQIETLNLYITFHLLRILQKHEKQTKDVENITNSRKPISSFGEYQNFTSTSSDSVLTDEQKHFWDQRTGKKIKDNDFKFQSFEYENDWHIRTASRLLMIFYRTNEKRKNMLNSSSLRSEEFYNTMLDFIDYKHDFDNWRGFSGDHFKSFTEIIWLDKINFNLCNYSFLLSLGIKISIMEYEVRRIMEFEAEQAFLSSLDKGRSVAVYLRIQVRRKYVTNDSLRCLTNHQNDLMKSLRVEFINEPGIDAGGLRKEWFHLLTKSLFNPLNGLFSYSEESHLSWFSMRPIIIHGEDGTLQNNELYYLFGIVVGLAIFNSTILDLQFPKAFYKKLRGDIITFNDYLELYPHTGNGIQKMLDYEEEDFFDTFGLYFETVVKDNNIEITNDHENLAKKRSVKKEGVPSSSMVTVQLCENGSNVKVTKENKVKFMEKWVDFYMNTSIENQFQQFKKGFHQVFKNCKSIELFSADELEKLVCGSQESNCYDFQMLRSVTKYSGGFSDKSKVIGWFWDIIENWDLTTQKKLLRFISGSDRVPPTGVSTLRFKISRLGNGCDSDRLPLAHTCFNELCIWEYSSKQKLQNKLWWAIMESEGYAFK